jgi:hypothetical protein
MTDPVSLTFGISSLLQTIAATSIAVFKFVQTCRKARGDILGINDELSMLKGILEFLKDDTDGSHVGSIPDSLIVQINQMVSHCNHTLDKITTVLEKHSDSFGPAKWALDGKKEVSSLQQELAVSRGALNLTLAAMDM